MVGSVTAKQIGRVFIIVSPRGAVLGTVEDRGEAERIRDRMNSRCDGDGQAAARGEALPHAHASVCRCGTIAQKSAETAPPRRVRREIGRRSDSMAAW